MIAAIVNWSMSSFGSTAIEVDIGTRLCLVVFGTIVTFPCRHANRLILASNKPIRQPRDQPTNHSTLTKLFPQKRQRQTADSNSSTIQHRATPTTASSPSPPEAASDGVGGGGGGGGDSAFRQHPTQVRAIGVDRTKDVIEQRAVMDPFHQHEK